MFSTKLLIAAMALAGTQAVSVKDNRPSWCPEHIPLNRCVTARSRRCTKNEPGSEKWIDWQCDAWEDANGLAQVSSEKGRTGRKRESNASVTGNGLAQIATTLDSE